MSPRPESRKRGAGSGQKGFALVTAIFILVVLAGLGAAMVTISTSQHTTVAMDIQSARAYQAARAGIEWGAYQALQTPLPAGFTCPMLPAAAASYVMAFTGTPLAGFSDTVTCNSTVHTVGANTVTVYMITSTATYGVANTPDYVAREVSARIARCVAPGGSTC
jgi:MSHA biogenesis protein MshP